MASPRARRTSAIAIAASLTAAAAAQGLVTDVPHRGAHVYTRTTNAFEVTARPTAARPEWVTASADAGSHEWRWFAGAKADVPAGFERPGFDDSAWATGHGEFGADPANPGQRSDWRSEVLCLRSTVDLGAKKPKALWIVADHDDGLRVWLNGSLVVADDGYGRGRNYMVGGASLDAWQRGRNVVAVSCTNIGGAQYCDLRIGLLAALPPGCRSLDDLQRTLQQDRELAMRVQADLFGPLRAPALLLQGELDAAQRRLAIPPGDLRDLAFWIATDLSIGQQGGAVQLDAGRLFRLGDLQIRGRAGAIDANGWQTIEVAVKNTAEPANREDTNRAVERYVRPHVWYGFDGRLFVRRKLAMRGNQARLDECTTELTGRVLRGKDWKEYVADVRQRESFRFAATRNNQDADFRVAVGKALANGTARLRAQLANLTAPELAPSKADATDSYPSGRLAIGLLALLKGGVKADDEVVQRGLAELRQRRLIDTYSLGNAMMVIETLHAPPREFGDLTAGTIDRPRRRTPPPADAELLRRWADQLLTNVDTRTDPTNLLRFNYTRGDRFDHSVNQYGLLGLYSAHLCGIELPATVWEAAANHLIAAQSPDGGKIELELVDYRTHARREAEPGATFSIARSSQRGCGWSYMEPKDDGESTPVWGSMTCAGITGLAICQAALQEQPGNKRLKLQADAARARRDGFAWLALHMTSRCHPGAIERQQRWFYYYLYGLERAALLSGVALIQDRDWYFEGAMTLVLVQEADGNWPAELLGDDSIERNAMAILFLKQGTLPVLTGQ